MKTHPLNSDTFTIETLNATSQSIDFSTQNYPEPVNAVIYNASNQDVFVVAGSAQPTAVFPTSSSTPSAGKVVGAGATVVYQLNSSDNFISAIQKVAGAGGLYVSFGEGE